MKKLLLVLIGLTILSGFEFLKVYTKTYSFVYASPPTLLLLFNAKNIWWLRIAGWGLLNIPIINYFEADDQKHKIIFIAALLIYAGVCFYCNYMI
jgi:hypothetical protein